MDDPELVCGFERLGDLTCDRQRLVERTRCDAIGQRRAVIGTVAGAFWGLLQTIRDA